MGGAETTHIREGIDIAALLGDLNTFLGKASSSTKVIPGTTSAAFGITLRYSGLNQPQTISAPANPQSFSAFEAKLRGIVQQLGAGQLLGSLGASTGGTSTTSSAGPASAKYGQCIQRAGDDVGKMQKCASLINSGG